MFSDDDFECEVWPENWPSFQLFAELRTQWRHGLNGPTGLDYTAVLAVLRAKRLPRERADEMFADIRVMERAALNEIHRK
ncbi:DUF1799 domain-containing protein [Tessaracoccus sp.]|uniref:DUF1799 domain-containing protein n=1 Tax=Tessaracoccus sp. TaxID=1971211 RepID=UPI002632B346|nr:DUF1799 domain-containing protein [Tessaracoccus sp.]